jgi:DNA-binding response OmpR family regulator
MVIDMQPLVLIVEDDSVIASTVADRVVHEGWRAEVVSEGTAVVNVVKTSQPDAIVLDIMLPGIDGFDVIAAVREVSTVPIIMLTARADIDDELRSLDLGADDFLTKPLRPSVLIAHLNVWIKRYQHIKELLISEYPDDITVGDLRIDRRNRTAEITASSADSTGDAPKTTIVTLTPTEFALLATLATAPDQVFSRDVLLKRIWNWDDADGTRTVDAHVKSLRRRIGAKYIVTVHGVGYKLSPTGEER